MSNPRGTHLVALSLLAALALACAAPGPPVAESEPVLAAYVLLVPGPAGARPLARVVLDGPTAVCPTVTPAGGVPVAMVARDNPHGFEVTVCEQYVDFGVENTVSGWSQPLPVATDGPTHPLVIGDTGCKEKDCASGTPAEPFATLAGEAAARAPDLVLHAGDFNYRGTGGFDYEIDGTKYPEYDAGDVPSPGGEADQCQLDSPYVSENASYATEHRDNWGDWNDDLFTPAAPLLAAAPWIVTRGNHELCSRAGPGWFYFLDPGTNLEGGTQASCPAQEESGGGVPASPIGHIVTTEARVVALETLRVVVFDSANACDRYSPEYTTAQYASQIESILAGIPASPPTWFLTHRPFWGAEGSDSVTVTLEAALDPHADSLPEGLDLVVSGHMHQFQSVTFPTGSRPPQLVVGNGGVKLATPDPAGSFSQEVDGVDANGLALAHHGFLDISSYDPSTGAWSGQIVDKHDDVIGECGSAASSGSICGLVTGTPPTDG